MGRMISVFVCVVVVVVDDVDVECDDANIVPHSPHANAYTILMSAAIDQVFRRSLYDYSHFHRIDSHFVENLIQLHYDSRVTT